MRKKLIKIFSQKKESKESTTPEIDVEKIFRKS